MPPDDWSAKTADAIGRRVGELRRDRKLTVQQLSDALADLGVIMNRPVLSNLENGSRHTISAAEVLALAKVLEVPPVTLIAPVGRPDPVEILPAIFDDAWTVYRWFIGEFPTEALGEERDPAVRYFRGDDEGKRIDIYRRHHNGLYGFLTLRGQSPDAARRQIDTLAAARIEMHRAGWSLPPLPDDVRPALEEPLRAWGYRAVGDELVGIAPGEVDVDTSGGNS